MRRGDLSNKVVPRVLVRMNEVMFEEVPKDTVLNKVKSKLGLPPSTEYQIKAEAFYFLEKLVTQCDYNVHLVYIQDEDKGFGDKVEVIDNSLLVGLNILTYSTIEPVYNYLNTPSTILVDTNCSRSNIYTLEEAIYLLN